MTHKKEGITERECPLFFKKKEQRFTPVRDKKEFAWLNAAKVMTKEM